MNYKEKVVNDSYGNMIWVAVDINALTWEYMENDEGESYMSGNFDTEGKIVVDYDGCFELPVEVLDFMDELGYITDDIRV